VSRRWRISRRGGVRSPNVAYSVQCDGLEDDFSVASSRHNWSLAMGTYLQSQLSRVHWASGKWGTVLPEYSTPNCASTASQASRPGKIRTPRNNPDLCAFLSARIERAICDGVLRIGALISVAPDKCLQTLKFSLIVSPNAPSRPLTSGRCGGLSEMRSGTLIRQALDPASQVPSKPSTEIHDGKYHI
jgi:hypothetical protein